MSDLERRLERVQSAGQRLSSAELERAEALQEATLAIQASSQSSVEELSTYSGLSQPAVYALLARRPARPAGPQRGN